MAASAWRMRRVVAMASVARSRWVGEFRPAVRRVMIWDTARWPSMVEIRAATSWLTGAPSGRSGVVSRWPPLELVGGESEAALESDALGELGDGVVDGGAVEVGGSLESAGLDFVDGVGEVGGQVSLVEDGAFVASRGPVRRRLG